MREVVSEAYRLFAEYLYRALVGGTPEERFRLAGQSYLDFAIEQPALYEVLYVPPDLLGIQPGSSEGENDHACAVGRFWSDRVREMMDAGFFHEGDVDEVSLVLWSHAHGMISLYHRGLLGVSSDGEFRVLLTASYRLLLRGIGTETYQALVGEGATAVDQQQADGKSGIAVR